MRTVYIGTLDGAGLTVATADPTTGALTPTGTVVDLPEPSFFAFSADRRTLYTVGERPEGSVTAVDISDPVRPAVMNTQPTGGAGPTHLSVHHDFLLTAHYTDGTVTVHPLRPDGSIGPRTGALRHEGDEPHAHQVVTDPSGRWVLAVDLGLDAVFTHRVDQRTGAITTHARMSLPRGTGPRHLVFHPDGTRAHILGESRPVIITAGWDPTTGTLTPTNTRPVIGPHAPDPSYPAEIVINEAGEHLYASTRGEDAIAVLRANGPSLVQSAPTGGAWPRHCVLAPGERLLYVANQNSGTVTWLPRDPETGLLGAPAGSMAVRGACFIAFP
ncbi:MAG: lactonase family protein [Actinomycetota bacterium]|nr:lactonase family protein [Actinomycetota bacterium]